MSGLSVQRERLTDVQAGDSLTVDCGRTRIIGVIDWVSIRRNDAVCVRFADLDTVVMVSESGGVGVCRFVEASGPAYPPIPVSTGLFRDAKSRIWLHAGDRWVILRAANGTWTLQGAAHMGVWQKDWNGSGISVECAPFTRIDDKDL